MMGGEFNGTGDVLDWPDSRAQFWWMQYKLKPKGKCKVMLIEIVTHSGAEFAQPFQDNNAYSKSICVDWSAKFKPCFSSPVFESES